MSWSLGTLTNNYSQPVGIQIFAANGTATDYSTAPIRGGNINIIIPLRGTLAFVDLGRVPGSVPPNGIDVFFLDQSWSFRYDQTAKINVTIDSTGNPTLQQT
jgi:hypothetical protein